MSKRVAGWSAPAQWLRTWELVVVRRRSSNLVSGFGDIVLAFLCMHVPGGD
jgi:hypothetical protein